MAVVVSVPHQRFSSSGPRRDSVLSSGRGGSGNIRRLDTTQNSPPTFDVNIISIRGREALSNSDKFVVSSGRGGSGNMRPPSPDRETHPLTAAILSQHVATQAQYEMQIRKKHAELQTTRSSGRGGSGNISDQRRARSKGPSSSKSFLSKGRAKATRDDTSTDAESHDRNEPHMGIHRSRGRDSTLTSSSGADSLLTGSSQRSVAGSSISGLADQDPCSSSPPSPTTDRTKKKRSFLARWKKPPSSPQPGSPTEVINTVLTEGEIVEPDSQQSCDRLSLEHDGYEEFPPSYTSPRASSAITSTSSHSNRYSQQSALSLPNILEGGEYVSFLEF
ncbi:hypothetical protein PAXINDRAFT_169455 [Paxillus involutus ATCC 200175]|uniref:Uncharacterized protein n=1 Tax=Paxillus involutus ATCC 200175 TaxID=664439 RepID=A0A0C9U5R7_PAXIN|nr:hypothetical protein PAXINDRAFT_169455 [Paxillus involutus ATCC 200175]